MSHIVEHTVYDTHTLFTWFHDLKLPLKSVPSSTGDYTKLTCSQQNLCIFHFKEEHTPSSPSGLRRMYAGTLQKKSIYQKPRCSWAWASVLINSQSLQRHVRCSEQKWRQRWFKPPGCAMFWRNTQTLGGSCHPGSAVLREQWTHCVRRPWKRAGVNGDTCVSTSPNTLSVHALPKYYR